MRNGDLWRLAEASDVQSWALTGLWYLDTGLKIAAVLVLGWLAIVTVSRLVDRATARSADQALPGQARRLKTLTAAAKSLVRYTVDFLAAVIVLSLLGIDTSSLLLGAGVVGLAVGFGAQTLVRDVLAGFFFLVEDQFSVGDHVSLDDLEGIVDDVGLRTTRLRSFGGELHVLPNGGISRVTNYSRGPVRVLFEVEFAYGEDAGRVIRIAQEALDRYRAKSTAVLEGPKALGLSRVGPLGVSLQIWAMVKAMEQWTVERELRLCVKEALDQARVKVLPPAWLLTPGQTARPPRGPRPAGESAEDPGSG